ncbi:SMP-30/gluconolactonase/LRE family protein [Gluconobacter sp. Dm-73]|uniref:SMP-30/gluconolactonase/LRE family protein n=1 Tax=Gluconobacter sp. Dm-73 TaxID=2799802 RepID=UPI001B8CB70E|nr:SMP-30/gluconolactonase/LRE family protein [Gluconobacter sp. Dm-73]MBS1074002.1 SMP-30/gluconolactonase/LRE family protein [Gluconobacter sp. Dm-73]
MNTSLFPGVVPAQKDYLARVDYAPVLYDPTFDCFLPNSDTERLATGMAWGEGPVWFGDGRFLLWSDIPNNRILRWTEETGQVSVFRGPSGFANGNTRDLVGRLITCEHETRRVTRTEHDGTMTVIADRFSRCQLNSPNDVVVAADGAIWFTDPDYGLRSSYEGGGRGEQELPTSLYRVGPRGGIQLIEDGFLNPNGLAFSPDGSILYVIDTGASPNLIWACQLNESRDRVTDRHILIDAAQGMGDGLRCDDAGNLWCGWGGSEGNGVKVFGKNGEARAFLPLPERCANLCFGGQRRNRLFMAASHSLYAVYVNIGSFMKCSMRH